jgi:hypothetical protein
MDIELVIGQIHSLLTKHLPHRTGRSPKGWTTFDCAMCSDRKKRAGIIQSGPKISYHCFNCSFSTGWQPGIPLGRKYKELAQRLGCDTKEIHQAQLSVLRYSEILEAESEGIEIFVPGNVQFKRIPLPPEAVLLDDLPDDNMIKQYAIERGIFGISPLLAIDNDQWKGRLVIPFMYNGELVGFTGRMCDPENVFASRYIKQCPSDYVFNLDAFSGSEREIVVVTEGIIDAILIDGVSIGGNEVSPEQAHLIERLGKRVILCPDKDSNGKILIQQAIALGWEVSFPPWEKCKDIANACDKYGRLLTLASIVKYANKNPLKSEVMMRMNQ